MIALDTNILVYAHRRDAEFHEQATKTLRQCAEGHEPWAIPWPCIHEFLAVVTNSKIWKHPTPMQIALKQIELWSQSPTVVFLGEGDGYLDVLQHVLSSSSVSGGRVHDARVAAISLYHRVREIWTADRDFQRFAISAKNPLIS